MKKDQELVDIGIWLAQALDKINHPSKNANGQLGQLGGVYWRLMKSSTLICQRLNDSEGTEHAEFLRRTHGTVAFHGNDEDDMELVEQLRRIASMDHPKYSEDGGNPKYWLLEAASRIEGLAGELNDC